MLKKDGIIIDDSYYNYANILNIDFNKKTSTHTILQTFKKDNPYGVYLSEKDEEFLEKKINNFKKSTRKRLEFLKRKHKNGFLVDKKEYTFEDILDIFVYTYDAKKFLKNALKQSDIDEGIAKFKKLTLNKTHSKYSGNFDAKPNLWKSVVNKTFYDKPLENYYVSVFDLKNNNKFKSLNSKSKILITDILAQSLTAHRVGKVYINLEYFGINKYISKSILNKIDNMITISVEKKIKIYLLLHNLNKSQKEKYSYITNKLKSISEVSSYIVQSADDVHNKHPDINIFINIDEKYNHTIESSFPYMKNSNISLTSNKLAIDIQRSVLTIFKKNNLKLKDGGIRQIKINNTDSISIVINIGTLINQDMFALAIAKSIQKFKLHNKLY